MIGLNFKTFFITLSFIQTAICVAQNPNFHIYLAFGQSNMDGAATIEAQDKQGVSDRFKNLNGVVGCSGRILGEWYAATPPLNSCSSGLSPMDYFGRTLVDSLPDSISVGVAMVAIPGTKIEIFDKDNYQDYINTAPDWMTGWIDRYSGNPYARMVYLGKKAQEQGVIKGILLHQGESNNTDRSWLPKVKAIYDNLMTDLNLDPTKVPLLAGEMVGQAEGGSCWGHNAVIADLPKSVTNSHVISSSGLAQVGDGLHFTALAYREFGKRYAQKMLSLLPEEPEDPITIKNIWLEPECMSQGSTYGQNWQLNSVSNELNSSYLMSIDNSTDLLNPTELAADAIKINFTADSSLNYHLFAYANNPTADDDSFWFKINDGQWTLINNSVTSGWEWIDLGLQNLTQGNHTLTISARENGASLDKFLLTNLSLPPIEFNELELCSDSIVGIKSYSLNSPIKMFNSPFKIEQNHLLVNWSKALDKSLIQIQTISVTGEILFSTKHLINDETKRFSIKGLNHPKAHLVNVIYNKKQYNFLNIKGR